MTKLAVGDVAPDFSLEDQSGSTVRRSDFAGQKLLLYFYPKANTPGCTRQSCSVRDAQPDLEALGVAVLGISPDAPSRQRKFAEQHSLGFPLLSDPDHTVARAYGAWGEKTLYGKKVEGIIRSSFLIDEEGRVLQAAYKVKPEETVHKARALLG